MAVFNEPTKWAQTLGQHADVVSIPDTAGDTEPSINKIFPSVFSIPLSNGGRAIPRSVLNGLFKLLGDWIYYIQNGGIASYTNAFDYKIGSFVKHNDEFYRCIQANNHTSPKAPTDLAYWSKITTLADVANAFANQDLSNLSASGQTIIDNKADLSFSNVNNTAKILMAHNVMPANVYDELTLGASGDAYTTPADGYVSINISCPVANGEITLLNNYGITVRGYAPNTASSSTPKGIVLYIPIPKNISFSIIYPSGSTANYFRFYYAVGSLSEQA